MANKDKNKLVTLSTLEIKNLYNTVRMVGRDEIPNIAKQLNKKTILVLMERKKKKPEEMPEWFKKWNKKVFEPRMINIETRLTNLETLVITQFKKHRGIK